MLPLQCYQMSFFEISIQYSVFLQAEIYFLLQKGIKSQHINDKPAVYFPSLTFERITSTMHQLYFIESKPVVQTRDTSGAIDYSVVDLVHPSLLRGDGNTSIEPDMFFFRKTPEKKISLK